MARNYIVIDTETAPRVKHKDGDAHPETSLVYDIGWQVISPDGSVLAERSFINTDVFFTEYMKSAYYQEKLPSYWNVIRSEDSEAEWYLDNFLNIFNQFKEDVRVYGVKDIWAYNARFDRTALNATIEWLSSGYVKWFTPYAIKSTKIRWRDIWDYASCITGTKKYVKWCKDRGFVSAKGNPSTSAETVYRYLADDDMFIEDHTALSDVRIEAAILQAAKKRHQQTRHSMGQGWRDAAKIAKTM